jgi:hypothetical protein
VSRTDKEALARAMAEWPQRVVDAGVTTADGKKYRPVKRNVSPLRYLDDPDALLAEMLSILNEDEWDDPHTGASGWDVVIRQAGPDYVWECLIMDKTLPWADLFTDEHRWKVAIAVAHTLKRGL